ncbi:hypothetical protein ETD83_21715 [Actinomadura soli]|uniref:Uncharacterized protein n=1 Tax=Actinomadura soli TaxID=2508997 RepID=A0A5C4J8I8_9ACTN|nr:hypothetical protein [Actinomadura soli]TMQ96188.1 hypothetical protein ETD83_21715 [Actinomadura soli]
MSWRDRVEATRGVRQVVGRWWVVLEWRTFAGHEAAVRKLELLRVAMLPMGWRCVGLYDRQELRFPVPLLWVYARGTADDIGVAVTVRALPGQAWGYFEAGDGRGGFVSPCADVNAAAEALDLLLKHRMFPRREWS